MIRSSSLIILVTDSLNLIVHGTGGADLTRESRQEQDVQMSDDEFMYSLLHKTRIP